MSIVVLLDRDLSSRAERSERAVSSMAAFSLARFAFSADRRAFFSRFACLTATGIFELLLFFDTSFTVGVCWLGLIMVKFLVNFPAGVLEVKSTGSCIESSSKDFSDSSRVLPLFAVTKRSESLEGLRAVLVSECRSGLFMLFTVGFGKVCTVIGSKGSWSWGVDMISDGSVDDGGVSKGVGLTGICFFPSGKILPDLSTHTFV